MEKLTEPGATKMWDGWFTVHWIPIIMDMASRQNHNAKKANTYNIAVKAAEKIRTVIKQGLYEMWKVRNDIKHEKQAQHKWTMTEVKDILRNLRKTKAIERHSAEEILTWQKRKIDNWAKRRMKDIEESTKEQQERMAALQRFNKKWNIFQPKHRDQHDESAEQTDDKGKHERTSENPENSTKSREETTDGNRTGRTKDTKSKQSSEGNKANIGDNTETTGDGQKQEQSKKQDSKELAEHSQNKGYEAHRNIGKRRAKRSAGQSTDDRNAKRKLRRKTKQTTLTQYMNRNGSDKRKREYVAYRNNSGEDTGERDNKQNNDGAKRIKTNQIETTKRKGIG